MQKELIKTIGALLAFAWVHVASAGELPARLAYEVLDGDKLVGHLDFSLESSAQELVARQRGELTLKRMMITAKIKQTIEERWQGKRLLALKSETTADATVGGSKKSLSVARDAAGTLRATNDKGTHELAANAVPLSIWSGRALAESAHFDLTTGEPGELKALPANNADQSIRYEGDECRPSRFESINGSKRSTVTAWLGGDEIVCQLRISAGRDVFTYVRKPAP